jgi:hypothetical protein
MRRVTVLLATRVMTSRKEPAFSQASITLVKVVIVRVALSLIGQRHMKMH